MIRTETLKVAKPCRKVSVSGGGDRGVSMLCYNVIYLVIGG